MLGLAAVALPLESAAADFTTVAGSGAAGIADGPAAQATFLLPYGVATGRDGTIYVTDFSAQNVRAIDKAGNVRTVAGGGDLIDRGFAVRGGYQDGPAKSARFNGPSGIAVDKLGRIFVADRYNRCIRMIANGVVSTYVGAPSKTATDGTLATAGFFQPRALAFSDDGTLWVGDANVGLRKITPDGVVTTVPLPATPIETPETFYGHITAIAPEGGRLMLADGVSLLDFNPAKAGDYQYSVPDFSSLPVPDHAYYGSNKVPAGYAFGAAYLTPDTMLYTDPILQAIRVRKRALNFPITGRPAEDDDFMGGGFRNGTDGVVDGPLGIAALGEDRAVFADSGNRRIRMISNLETRHFADSIADPFGKYADGSKYYRILIVGNSMLANSLLWGDTAGGRLEAELNAHRAALGITKPVKVALIWLGTNAEIHDFIDEAASSYLADTVILDYNVGFVNRDVPGADQYASPLDSTAQWKAGLIDKVRSTRKTLRDAGIPFYVAIQPTPEDYPPFEETAARLTYPITALDPEKFAGDEALYRSIFGEDGTPVIDLFAAFDAIERAPGRVPLFGSRDHHLSAGGQAAVAAAFYKTLTTDKPWLKPPPK